MSRVYLGLGSNLGNREENLRRGVDFLTSRDGFQALRLSPWYETEPVGYKEQDWFLNAVLEGECGLPPLHLLALAGQAEEELGRVRTERWGPRSLDVDILLYDQLELIEPGLTIPHPRLKEREFVLRPLADLAPELVLPGGETLVDLLQKIQGKSGRVLPWTGKK